MCSDFRCPWRVGKMPCPFEIGDHPATLAEARDQRLVSEALAVTGSIPVEEAERQYAAWKAHIAKQAR